MPIGSGAFNFLKKETTPVQTTGFFREPPKSTASVALTAAKTIPITFKNIIASFGRAMGEAREVTPENLQQRIGEIRPIEGRYVTATSRQADIDAKKLALTKIAETDKGLFNALADFSRDKAGSYTKKLQESKPQGLTAGQNIIYDVIATAPSIITGLTVAAITKSAGLGIAAAKFAGAGVVGLNQFSVKYNEYRNAGKTPEEATGLALAAGGLEGVVEYFTLGKVMNLTKPVWKKILLNVATEGMQEFIQTTNEGLVDMTAYNKSFNEEIVPLLGQASYSFLLGAIVGGPGAAIETVSEVRGEASKAANKAKLTAATALQLAGRIQGLPGLNVSKAEADIIAAKMIARVQDAATKVAEDEKVDLTDERLVQLVEESRSGLGIDKDFQYREGMPSWHIGEMDVQYAMSPETLSDDQEDARAEDLLHHTPGMPQGYKQIASPEGVSYAHGEALSTLAKTGETVPTKTIETGRISRQPLGTDTITESSSGVPVVETGLSKKRGKIGKLSPVVAEIAPTEVISVRSKPAYQMSYEQFVDEVEKNLRLVTTGTPVQVRDALIRLEELRKTKTGGEFTGYDALYKNILREALHDGKEGVSPEGLAKFPDLMEQLNTGPQVVEGGIVDNHPVVGTKAGPSGTKTGPSEETVEIVSLLPKSPALPGVVATGRRGESYVYDPGQKEIIVAHPEKWQVSLGMAFFNLSDETRATLIGQQLDAFTPEALARAQEFPETPQETPEPIVVEAVPLATDKFLDDITPRVYAAAKAGTDADTFIATLTPEEKQFVAENNIPMKVLYDMLTLEAFTAEPKAPPSLANQRRSAVTKDQRARLATAQARLTAEQRGIIMSGGHYTYVTVVDGKPRLVGKDNRPTDLLGNIEEMTVTRKYNKSGKEYQLKTAAKPAGYVDKIGSYIELEPSGDVYYYEHQADGTFVKQETPVITSEVETGPKHDAASVEDKAQRIVERKKRSEARRQAAEEKKEKRLASLWAQKEHGDVDAIVYDEDGNADVTAWFNTEELQTVGMERAQEDAAIDEESAEDVQEVESIASVTYNKNTGAVTFLNAAGEDVGDQYNFDPVAYDGLVDRDFIGTMRINADLQNMNPTTYLKASGAMGDTERVLLSEEEGTLYERIRDGVRQAGIRIRGMTLVKAKTNRAGKFVLLFTYDGGGTNAAQLLTDSARSAIGFLHYGPDDILGNVDNIVAKPNDSYHALEELVSRYSSHWVPDTDPYSASVPYRLYEDLVLADTGINSQFDIESKVGVPIEVTDPRLGFIGRIADTAKRIANLFAIIRNPKNEIGALVFTKNGRIVFESIATYRKPSTTSLMPAGYDYVMLIKEALADGRDFDTVYMVHNHPNGMTRQSKDDQKVFNTLRESARLITKNKNLTVESIILDHDHASIFKHDATQTAKSFEGMGEVVELPKYMDFPVSASLTTGIAANNKDELCYYLNVLRKRFKNYVLYLDANNRTVNIQELSRVPDNARSVDGELMLHLIQNRADEIGAIQAHLYIDNARIAEQYEAAYVFERILTDKNPELFVSGVYTLADTNDGVKAFLKSNDVLVVTHGKNLSQKQIRSMIWSESSADRAAAAKMIQDGLAKDGNADAGTLIQGALHQDAQEADVDRSFELETAETTAEEYFKDAVNPTPDASFPTESDSTVKRWWKKFWAGAKRFDMFISSIPRLQEMTNIRLWSEFSKTYDSYLRAENAFERETAAFLKDHKLNSADDKAIYLYALQQQNENGGLSAVLRKMGVDPNVKMTLTKEQMEAYNYCRKWFDELYVATQDVSKRMNDEFGHQKNYFPVVRVSDDDSFFPLKYEDTKTHDVKDYINKSGDKIHLFTQDQAKAWMLEREGGDYQTVVSAFDVLAKYVDDANYYINCGEEIHKISDLVGTNAALLKMGRTGRQVWMEWSDALARRGGMASGRIKALDSMRNNLATAIFGFKAASAFLQLGSTVDTIAGTGIENWWLGAKMAVNQDWLAFVQENAPGVYKVYEDITLSEINKGKNLFKRWAFAPLMKMDRIVRINTFLAFYTKFCNDNGVEIDFTKPNLEMIDQAMAATVRTQGSSNFKDSNIFITQGNWGGAAHIQSVTKAIMMFQNFPLTRFHNMVDKIYTHGIKSKNYKGAADGLWYLLLVAVALELLTRKVTKETLAGLLGKDADDKKFWTGFGSDMLRTAIGNLPGGGTFVGVSEGYSEWIPLFREFSDVAKGLNQVTRGATANTRTNGAVMLAKGVASMAGIPGTYQAEELSRYARKRSKIGLGR